jgi:LSD1 subclass zinc finger protein
MAEPKQFPCKQCGAMLEFEPGTRALKCQYCGTLNEIAESDTVIEELDYAQQLLDLQNAQPTLDAVVIHCDGCGGESTLPDGHASGSCPFCGRSVVATTMTRTVIKPRSLLPFAIKSDKGRALFDGWLASLWFAPSDLKKHASRGGLRGVYVPAWTYDCRTISHYTGERGEHYWETQTYTTRVNGKSVTQTRQVRKTRWYSAAGTVFDTFDDVLVLADRSLPVDLRNRLSGWDLPNLVPYDDAYLSGFVAETYQVDLAPGFEIAKQIMEQTVRASVRRDIGGDEQRIHTLSVQHNDITFKHILVPVWISAYRYRDRTFHFLINARTGAVVGHRPWSAWKIAFLVIAIALTIGLGLAIYGVSR